MSENDFISQEEKNLTEQAMSKLKDTPEFKESMLRFGEADEKSQQMCVDLANNIINLLELDNDKLTVEQARFNLLVAKLVFAKALATLSSFNYEEPDFLQAMERARHCVAEELVPMLINEQPCKQCDECKKGNFNNCIHPIVRSEYCESRFLPILCEALIEYDVWNEILYYKIPAELTDSNVLGDLDEEFHDKMNVHKQKKKRGRPSKQSEKEE